jgi:DnaK suppressor protein
MTRNQRSIDNERYAVLKTMLGDRRSELQGKLRSLRETLPAEVLEVRDPEEQSVDDFVQDMDFALMQMKSETLAKIDEALHRLDNGSYGLCADCGTDIPEARLQALPFADRCRACQERTEVDHREAGHSQSSRAFLEGVFARGSAPR